MSESLLTEAIQLVKAMRRYTKEWDWELDRDFDGETRFGEKIKELGYLSVIEAVFAESNHTHPESLLLSFTFIWKDLSFADWLELARRLSGKRYGGQMAYAALYDFIVFTGWYLAIDICRIIATDTHISPAAKTSMARIFKHCTPAAELNWVSESLKDAGLDPHALWRRLEGEGAPMMPFDPRTEMNAAETSLQDADEHWTQGRLQSAYKLYAALAGHSWHAAFQLAWIESAFGPVAPAKLHALRNAAPSKDAQTLVRILTERVQEREVDEILSGSLGDWDIESLRKRPQASDGQWWMQQGEQALATGQWGLAEACYDEAFESSPSLYYDPPAKMHGLLGLIEGHLKTLGG